MIYMCVRCGERREIRQGSRTSNSLIAYQERRQELRQSFLRSDAELCPGSLGMLLEFVRSAPKEEEYVDKVLRRGMSVRSRIRVSPRTRRVLRASKQAEFANTSTSLLREPAQWNRMSFFERNW